MPPRIVRMIVLGVVSAAALFGVWDRVIKPQVVPKRFGVVTPERIYRSGKLTPATMATVVRGNKIHTIVDLGAWVDDPRGERLEARTAAVLGVERHVFDLIGDSTGDPNDYLEALRLMTDPATQPVLVHCGAGTERTGVLVYLYRTIVEGQDREAAIAEARRAGHDPRRNPRLAQTLDRWESEIARAFREGGRIETGSGAAGANGANGASGAGGVTNATGTSGADRAPGTNASHPESGAVPHTPEPGADPS